MRHLFSWHLGIQDMFLEEGILSVHVGAVEKSVSVDDLVPVVACVLRVIVLLILDVEFVTGDIFAREFFLGWQGLVRIGVLEAQGAILSFDLLSLSLLLSTSLIVEGLL